MPPRFFGCPLNSAMEIWIHPCYFVFHCRDCLNSPPLFWIPPWRFFECPAPLLWILLPEIFWICPHCFEFCVMIFQIPPHYFVEFPPYVPVANFKFSPHEIAKSWSMTTSSSHSQKLAHVLWWFMGLPLMAFEQACLMTKFITYTSYTMSDKNSCILQATTWLMHMSDQLACKLASSRWAILTKRFLMQVEFLALNALDFPYSNVNIIGTC